MGKKISAGDPAARLELSKPARSARRRRPQREDRSDQRPGLRTLGPVSDLERHLPSEWWRTLFNSLYLETDGDVIENDRNTEQEVDLLIRSAGIERNDRILDLCCGQGRHSLELARRGFPHVTGLDRSRYLIRLAASAPGSAICRSRSTRATPAASASATASFTACACSAIPSAISTARRTISRCSKRSSAPWPRAARSVMDLMDGEWMRDHFDPRSWEWVDQNHFVCRERELAGDGDRLISREVVVHAERGVIADQFYAERLYSKERLEALLTGAGFANVRFHAVRRPIRRATRISAWWRTGCS